MNVDLSRRFSKVWFRNLVVYKRIWKIDFILPLLEPIFYLLAFGIGFGSLIEGVEYRGEGISYVAYIAPALLSINIMYSSFFENTYASFVRMYYQKTYDAMLATPLTLDEIIVGEILWGATKALIGTILMGAVISLFGLVKFPQGLLMIPLSFIGGVVFGSIGMVFTGILPTIEMFNLPIFLFITPMFLFGDTFFPVENLPAWAGKAAMVFPLFHLTRISRSLCMGYIDAQLLANLMILSLIALVMPPVAIYFMKKRLIR